MPIHSQPPHDDDAAAAENTENTENTGRTDRIKESASRIWLAGLGALSRAQQEGGKVFDNLVKEGQVLQRKTQSAAGEKFSEAGTRMSGVAADLSGRASGKWERVESAVEDKLAKGLRKLGVPSMEDFEALQDRVAELERALARSRGTDSPREFD